MSTEKLRELKAVAEKAKELGGINNYKKGKDAVAAFQAAATPTAILALVAELEAKDKRIAELEAIATEYAGNFQKAQDAAKHLVIMNDSAQAEIAHLKELLARPVNLPKTNGHWDEKEKAFEDAITLAKREVRLAGFKCVGDE